MNTETIQKHQPTPEKFEKYPKNYQQNQHYKSVKQKLMTVEDDQDIIKFPFTSTSLQNRKSSQQYTSAQTTRKIQKYKGKKFQTVPLRTISYSTPLSHAKTEQFSHSSKTSRKSDSENMFASKNLFTNMKKLKDMRKTNYKNRITVMERKDNPQTLKYSSDNYLDLFKLTSTNFNYKDKMFSEFPEDSELLRKLTQTQGTTRNVIKFQNSFKSNQKAQLCEIQKLSEESPKNKDTEGPFFVLHPVKTQQTKSVEKPKSKKLIQTASTRSIVSKQRLLNPADKNCGDEAMINRQNANNFVRYSESTIQTENQTLRNGISKIRQIKKGKSSNPFRKSDFQHIPHQFRATFRVKHIDDNKNILLNTIKKKATTMERNQLVEYLKKVVK